MKHIVITGFYYNKNMQKCGFKSKGQMTIFIAFLFQILFVFFAMAINVGMMVHDKINLQNSVDLAAYYGAQKQAEALNVIAHSNFQIRQAWKLLTWRIRALGDAARANHPAKGNPPIRFSGEDTAWSGANQGASKLGVCVTNSEWSFPGTQASNENICNKGGASISIPSIPQLNFAFFPWDFLTQNILENLQEQYKDSCRGMGQYNRFMVVRWMAAYRISVGIRQQLINKMAEHLKDFKDISGESIEDGMLATFRANITRANLESLENQSGGFAIFNSMKDAEKEDWLPNVKIHPYIPYTDLYIGANETCAGDIKHIAVIPDDGQSVSEGLLRPYVLEPKGENEIYHSTRGVEKNPWYMVYVGAKAQTAPRKPFFPFGKPVVLEARAFAQPFGGRIGPWTQKFWQRQAGHAQSGDFIDGLMPPKFNGFESGFEMRPVDMPNYSRFPNDEIGLKSAPTLSILSQIRQPFEKMDIKVYDHLPGEAEVDPLAKPSMKPRVGDWQRRFEIAAISPDLFDITYYSIQPKFYDSYLQKMESLFTPQMPMPLDYGSTSDAKMHVVDQIQTAISLGRPYQEAYFIVNRWENVLTSWAPNATMDYTFPEQRFGECPVPPDRVPTDSNCVAGGRAGYSVKIVSKNYLESNELALGGDPSIKGPIFNPPSDF